MRMKSHGAMKQMTRQMSSRALMWLRVLAFVLGAEKRYLVYRSLSEIEAVI